MAAAKPPKKSETIEIRLSHAAKTAFMARCRREGLTASEALRRHIEMPDPPRPARRTRRSASWRMVLVGLFGAMLGAGAAVPSLARDGETSRARFDALDRNHDGLLDYREFRAR